MRWTTAGAYADSTISDIGEPHSDLRYLVARSALRSYRTMFDEYLADPASLAHIGSREGEHPLNITSTYSHDYTFTYGMSNTETTSKHYIHRVEAPVDLDALLDPDYCMAWLDWVTPAIMAWEAPK